MAPGSLSEFLLARIAEDERGPFLGDATHARLLADCRAKRQIAEMYAEFEGVSEEEQDRRWDGADAGMAEALYRVCNVMAEVYADHPDYQQEWTP